MSAETDLTAARIRTMAEIACHLCRRRKVKCDRTLPHCKVCLQTDQVCEYPLHAKKPGPKIGSLQRHKRRYRDREESIATEGTTDGTSRNFGNSDRRTSSRHGRRGLRSQPDIEGIPDDDDNHEDDGEEEDEDGNDSNDDSHRRRKPSTPPSGTNTTSDEWMQRRRNSRLNINDLSFILHPSHEASTPDQDVSTEGIGGGGAANFKIPTASGPSPAAANSNEHNNGRSNCATDSAPASPETQQQNIMQQASATLGMSESMLRSSITDYFANMVAVSLFHQPTFYEKLAAVTSPVQVSALLAAMMAFAARFRQPGPGLVPPEQEAATGQTQHDRMPPPTITPLPQTEHTPEHFLDMTRQLIGHALDECGDDPPTLTILQAYIICAHCELSRGVHGRAWRSLGMCVRLAYEMNLHLVDAKTFPAVSVGDDTKAWRDAEEKRRAWWAVWELDVYASTIRRTPTAVDWTQMETLLPVDDADWFDPESTSNKRHSCFMEVDPVRRWKTLQASGNQSPKAWFIVINSLMKDARAISSPRGVPSRGEDSNTTEQKRATASRKRYVSPPVCPVKEARQKLEILANCVQCFVMALPAHLQYRNQFLSFGKDSSTDNNSTTASSSLRQLHCGIYNIFIMTQLSRLMIHRYEIFGSHTQHSSSFPSSSVLPYFEAADNILAIVNRSCEEHVQYINPFLLSTIWLAAAVQLVRRHVAIPGATRGSNVQQKTLIKSRFDVLYLTYKRCAAFWNVRTAMEQNLEALEAKLERHDDAIQDDEEEEKGAENGDQDQYAATKRRSAVKTRDQTHQRKIKRARVTKDKPSRVAAVSTPDSGSSIHNHSQPSPDASLDQTNVSAPLHSGLQLSPQTLSLSTCSDAIDNTSTSFPGGGNNSNMHSMTTASYMPSSHQTLSASNIPQSFPTFMPMTAQHQQNPCNYSQSHHRVDSFAADTTVIPDMGMPLTMISPSLFGSDLSMDDMQQQPQYGGSLGFEWHGLDLPMDIHDLLSGFSEY
ncbi:hypothetical protein SBRCBS47491_001176 [Sporothrix bragantina]|uniref:Zn(2)-C6 fungal-type domain-containing protein n=1 Tax=Sporothrix bragantina TaxID=671064 RepID=A0ABP0AWB9_9PEZI